MSDSAKLTNTPFSSAAGRPPERKKWKLRGPWAVVLAALITTAGGLVALSIRSAPEVRKDIWPPTEPVVIDDNIQVDLLGCHVEGKVGVICQLKLASLVKDHGIGLRKDSIRLVDRAGRNFPPTALSIDAQSPVEVVPFPSELNISQNARVTFADVGNSLEDYELLRIYFGDPTRFTDFRRPRQFPGSDQG